MTRAQFLILTAATAIVGCGKKQAAPISANDTKEFFAAVDDGDAEIIRRLLQAKPGLVTAVNERGQTAMAVAKAKGNDDMVAVLKKAGGE